MLYANRPDQGGVRSGVTFVELAVLAALAALTCVVTVAVCRRVTESARRSLCLKNLKTIGTAMKIYAGENDGRFPYAAEMPAPGAAWAFTHPGVRNGIGDPRALICPSDAVATPADDWSGVSARTASYAYAFGLTEWHDSSFAFLADDDGGGPGEPLGPYRDAASGRATAHGADGGNFVSCDLHIIDDGKYRETRLTAKWLNGPDAVLRAQKGGTAAAPWNGVTGFALVN